ncbi:hypothetical protein [Anaerocolumna chitinilytica]|uniref:hypothetical protein n=1 Tax=Anaerocolumna chitinilytica TaxID=1727145 RepID=UPI001624173A|nr:hypothetical protein [Anaerocolumna chitinilytica]
MFSSKHRLSVRCILVFLFCTALLLIELNNPGIDSDSAYGPVTSAGSFSNNLSRSKKADAINEAAEPSGGISAQVSDVLTSSSLYFRVLPLKYIFLKTVLLYIPLILWTLLTVLLQGGYTARTYLIEFIHNSDGAKGEPASI